MDTPDTFYLGKLSNETNAIYAFPSKELVTHAMCVGMTGSGKTGLGIALIEEAALNGIPSLIIDPKGDMTNLLLQFPDAAPGDFEVWAGGKDPEKISQTWKRGWEESEISADRIRKMQEVSTFRLYTAGGGAARDVSILNLMEEGPKDANEAQDAASAVISSLCALLQIDADPLTGREHLLMTRILLDTWKRGEKFTLEKLIFGIQDPGIEKIGVLSLEDFFPKKDRKKLALLINQLVASPGFQGWLTGEVLDPQTLLHTEEGKPCISIFTLSHLSDDERMFFVSLFLNRLVTFMRTTQGTSKLRTLLYMDEIYGYFPPVENPPSKKPLLTLLKQARAYGLGIVLSTQNPSDLDYKGLSNIGTWFIGKLQTQQDRDRLFNNMPNAGEHLADTVANLPPRTFAVKRISGEVDVFKTRFTMSYLFGPMTSAQIEMLGQNSEKNLPKEEKEHEPGPSDLPDSVIERYLPSEDTQTPYTPSVYALVDVYLDAKGYAGTKRLQLATPVTDELIAVDWNNVLDISVPYEDFLESAKAGKQEGHLSLSEKEWKEIEKALVNHICREKGVEIYSFDTITSTGEEEMDAFLERIRLLIPEIIAQMEEEVQGSYAKKIRSLEEKIRKQKQRVEREEEQAKKAGLDSLVGLGSTILDGFLGSKRFGRTTVTKAAGAARSIGRSKEQKEDVVRAKETLMVYEEDLEHLLEERDRVINDKVQMYHSPEDHIAVKTVRPRKSDISVKAMFILWV